jgi:hypothetical protein
MSEDRDSSKPEKDTRWKKGGPSPNPHGRKGKPREKKNAASQALDQEITYVVNGQRKKSTVREGTALKLAKEAVEGNKAAIKMLLNWEKAARTEERAIQDSAVAYPLNEDDLKTIDTVCERIRATSSKLPS